MEAILNEETLEKEYLGIGTRIKNNGVMCIVLCETQEDLQTICSEHLGIEIEAELCQTIKVTRLII